MHIRAEWRHGDSVIYFRYPNIVVSTATFARQMPWETRQEYAIPEAQIPTDREQRFFWEPVAYNDETHDYFIAILEKANWGFESIPREFIAGTALRLIRNLAY